jgi:hypothetical protein
MMPYSVLTFCAVARGDFDNARELLAQARRRVDRDHSIAFLELLAARVELAAGELAAARRHAETAVSLARRTAFPFRLAQALSLLAATTVRTDPSTARTAVTEIVALERVYSHLPHSGGGYGMALVPAKLSLAAHDDRDALHTLRTAAESARENGPLTALAVAVVLVGVLGRLARPHRAATIGGVLTEGPYAPLLPIATEPDERAQLRLDLADLRDRLGDDDYATALATGAAMHLDGIVDTLLAAIDDALAALETALAL